MILIALCLGLGTMYCTYEFWNAFPSFMRIKQTPLVDIQNLTSGYLSIEGEIFADSDEIISPISKNACVYYSLVINERIEKNTMNRVSNSDSVICVMKKGNVVCKIDLAQAVFDGKSTYVGKTGTFDNPTKTEQEVLQHYSIKATNKMGWNKNLFYEEYMIGVGHRTYILGYCERILHSDNEFLIRGTGSQPIVISNMSRDALFHYYSLRVGKFGLLSAISAMAGLYIFFFTVL